MEIILKNVMEEYVLMTLDHVLDDLDCCKCDRCRLDIASYALNHLPPKYVANTRGELMTKVNALNTQFEVTVMSAIVQAALVVNENPRH